MSKTRYKINGDSIINVKGFGRLTNDNITDEVAEKLLSSGQYSEIISLVDPVNETKTEETNFKKKKKNSDNVDQEQDNKSTL